MSKIATLLAKDVRGVYRDGMLAVLAFYPLLLAGVLRVGLPSIPVAHLDLYLAPFPLILGGTVLGTVLGFALIEEREQQTWLLLRVLPLSQGTLFGYLGTLTMGFSVVVGLTAALIYGRPVAEPVLFVGMTLAIAAQAPLVMLLIGAAARNKVEGFAFAKILGTVTMLPALVFVVPVSWQPLLWWHPFYWVYVGTLEAYGAEASVSELALHWPALPPAAVVGVPIVLSAAACAALARVYRRAAL